MEYEELKFLEELFKKHSKSIVGRLCKQNEIIRDKEGLSDEQKLDIVKKFNRELVYESFRDLMNQVKCFSKGQKFEKYSVYKPPSGQ